MLSILSQTLIKLTVSGSLLAAVILLIRALLWKKISPHFQMIIWAVLLIRLVVPIFPQLPANWYTVHAADSGPLTSSVMMVNGDPAASSAGSSDTNRTAAAPAPEQNKGRLAATGLKSVFAFSIPSRGLSSLLVVGWLAGLSFALLYFTLVNLLFYRRINRKGHRAGTAVLSLLEECRSKLALPQPVRVISMDGAVAPAVFGIARPCILLPEQLENTVGPDATRYILFHELTHVKRKDNLLNVFLLVLEAVYWFNPLLWLAFSKIKDDCEIGCDADVLSVLGRNERRAYGYSIVNALQKTSSRLIPGTAGFAGNITKRRIVMLSSRKKTPLILFPVVLCLLIFAGCAGLPANSSSGTAKISASSGQYQTSSPPASVSQMETALKQEQGITEVAASHNQKNIAVIKLSGQAAGNVGEVDIIDISTGKRAKVPGASDDDLRTLSWSYDDKYLAIGAGTSAQGGTVIIDASNRNAVLTVADSSGFVWSSDSNQIVFAAINESVQPVTLTELSGAPQLDLYEFPSLARKTIVPADSNYDYALKSLTHTSLLAQRTDFSTRNSSMITVLLLGTPAVSSSSSAITSNAQTPKLLVHVKYTQQTDYMYSGESSHSTTSLLKNVGGAQKNIPYLVFNGDGTGIFDMNDLNGMAALAMTYSQSGNLVVIKTEFNQLSFQIVGSKTLKCTDTHQTKTGMTVENDIFAAT